MTSWDGTQTIRLTSSPDNETSPRFSPDGRYLAFLSGRAEGKGSQVWLLDRRGGEAERVTMIKGGVSEIEWSPDSKRLVVVKSVELDSALRADTTDRDRPIVITRYAFKQDVEGYLTSSRSHLFLFALAARKLDTLTAGPADDDSPRWSPDGSRIAFLRRVLPEPGTGEGSDVYVVDARAGAVPKAVTSTPGPEGGPPVWSPDGQWIAYLRNDEPKWYAYQLAKLAVVKADGSGDRVLTAQLDRPVSGATWSADSRSFLVTVDDDRESYLGKVAFETGMMTRMSPARQGVGRFSIGGAARDRIAAMISTPVQPGEVFAIQSGSPAPRQLTHVNDSLVASLTLAPTEDLMSRSKDGAEVHSILVRPAGSTTPLPTIFWIHGGPNSQSDYGFSFDRQLFAANGFAVVSPNYRGSTGRGLAFQRAIYADWGNKEVQDILGAVDQSVRAGIADSTRLGIGGWSYGGILTDYSIATTTRFKAAISGAGSALWFSLYGVDEYVVQYAAELGLPWKNQDLWIKLSYPFFHADRIQTPTLFMGGSADFNVPIVGGEQMYQALRELGVPTQMVIYPGQFHGITKPSFVLDRYHRYVAWFKDHLNPILP